MSILITGCAQNPLNIASNNCNPKQVPVTDVHWFKDAGGAWRIVGVIHNNSKIAVSKVSTGVETRTSSDKPADQGEDVSAYPLDLQPGEEAPFTAWIDRDIPGLDHFEVEVDDCVPALPEEHGQVDIHASQMEVDGAGLAEVTAQVTNPGQKTVLVNGMLVAVYDQAGLMLTAENAVITPRYLAPGESGPVRASLDLPPGTAEKVKAFKFFMDVLVNQPDPLALDPKRDIQLLSHYIDQNGKFHLVGQITNNGTKPLITAIQATVYADASKKLVVDAGEFDTWVPLEAGESLPFDLSNWGALSNTPGLATKVAGQDPAIDWRVEPFLTYNTTSIPAPLTISDSQTAFNAGKATFTGKVKNDSGHTISTGMVTAVIRQKTGGQIVAVVNAQLPIQGPAAPDQILDYSFSVPLPKGADSGALQVEVSAVGFQP